MVYVCNIGQVITVCSSRKREPSQTWLTRIHIFNLVQFKTFIGPIVQDVLHPCDTCERTRPEHSVLRLSRDNFAQGFTTCGGRLHGANSSLRSVGFRVFNPHRIHFLVAGAVHGISDRAKQLALFEEAHTLYRSLSKICP